MQKKILKCGLVGGAVVFFWGMISRMVLPWHTGSLHRFKDEKRVYEVIKESALESGIYILPNMYLQSKEATAESSKQMSEQKQMMAKGPVMFASVCQLGVSGMSLKPFITSLVIQMVGAAIITWMLLQTKLNNYKKQVIFITAAGFLVAILGFLPSWNWWGFSIGYTFSYMLDAVVGWFLAGLAIGKLSRN